MSWLSDIYHFFAKSPEVLLLMPALIAWVLLGTVLPYSLKKWKAGLATGLFMLFWVVIFFLAVEFGWFK